MIGDATLWATACLLWIGLLSFIGLIVSLLWADPDYPDDDDSDTTTCL